MYTDNYNFFRRIHTSLHTNPEKVLLRWAGEDFTGFEILAQINQYRNALKIHHIQANQKILLAVPVSAAVIFMVLALIAHGAVPVFPPAKASSLQILQLFKKLNIRSIVLQKSKVWISFLLSLFGIKIIPIFGSRLLCGLCLPELPHESINVPPTQPALLTHTSGSTGKVKSITRSHAVLSAQHLALAQAFPAFEGQRDFPLFPNILLHNLSAGVLSVMPDIPQFQLKNLVPEKIIRQIESEVINTLTGNVFYFDRLLTYLQQNQQKITGVKAIGIGGSPVPECLLVQIKEYFVNAEVYVIYGSSEAEPIAIRQVKKIELAYKGYCVGKVSPQIDLEIETQGRIKVGEKHYSVGEIKVQGNHVALAGRKHLYTGDFGYLDDSGQLFLTGRKGNETLLKNIQHYQIEHTLCNLAGVSKVAAVARNQNFEVYIVSCLSEDILRATLDSRFPQDLISRFHFRAHLPMDNRHHSKILYNRLR
jgi:acyl-coenzyme A synthetase/AMP-(fatty) acid ligase